jgi:hypothetical protein
VAAALSEANAAGVENWQANFKITPYGVEMTRYFKLQR